MTAQNEPKHHDLFIKHVGERAGYRIVAGANSTQFMPNPKVLQGDTVTWHSPDKDVCIVFLKESPFDLSGKNVTMNVIEVPKGQKSPTYTVSGNATPKVTYEYAVLVREADRDYTYVRGAASPPGVAVGP
jgi:hypothetical protein